MMYVLNEALKRKKYSEPDLFAPGEPCKCECSDDCEKARCKDCREVRKDCKICTKNEAYEMLTTGMKVAPQLYFADMQKLEFLRSDLIYMKTQKLAEQFSALMLILFTCFVLARKCLAERKKFFKLTLKRKTN